MLRKNKKTDNEGNIISKNKPENIINHYGFLQFCIARNQCIFLTGTPVQYTMHDLYDICTFLNMRNNIKDEGNADKLNLNKSNIDAYKKDVDGAAGNPEKLFFPLMAFDTDQYAPFEFTGDTIDAGANISFNIFNRIWKTVEERGTIQSDYSSSSCIRCIYRSFDLFKVIFEVCNDVQFKGYVGYGFVS